MERLSKVFNEISKSKFDYLELAVPWINGLSDAYDYNDVLELINAYNMNVGSFCSLMPSNIKVVGKHVDKVLIKQYLEGVFMRCNQIGGSVIVFGSGVSREVPDNYSHKRAESDIVDFLKIADEIITKNNYELKMAIEPLNENECNIINTISEAYTIAQMVNSKNVGILIDTYHAGFEEESIIDTMSKIADKLIHVHLSQPENRKWPGRLSDDLSFSFASFFYELKNNSYAGGLTVECNFDNLPDEINKCFAFLDETMGLI